MAAEKNFENQVKAFLKEQGCWTLKTWSNGVQREGIPDLLVCCNGYFLGIELKADKGKPTTLQLYHIDQINQAGGIAFVLYPGKFYMLRDLVFDLKHGSKKQIEFWKSHLWWFES